jgi:hypothetical protein
MRHALSASALFAVLCCSLVLADESGSPEMPAEPAAILSLLGVADRLDSTEDGLDFPADGDELLWRLLAAVRRFPLVDIDRWKQSELSPEALGKDPASHRGSLVGWTGTVTRVAEHKLPAEAAERFNLPRYYRCEMTIAGSDARAIVYALAVPKEWLSAETINERASVSGLFVRLAENQPESTHRPAIVARRVAWHPRNFLGSLTWTRGYLTS